MQFAFEQAAFGGVRLQSRSFHLRASQEFLENCLRLCRLVMGLISVHNGPTPCSVLQPLGSGGGCKCQLLLRVEAHRRASGAFSGQVSQVKSGITHLRELQFILQPISVGCPFFGSISIHHLRLTHSKDR